MAVKELTAENFDQEVLQAEGPVMVDFWAPWCGPCQMMGPIVDDLAQTLGDKITFAKLNVDDHGDVSGKYGVLSIPTFLMFKNGEVVDQVAGGMQKERLQEFLEKHI